MLFNFFWQAKGELEEVLAQLEDNAQRQRLATKGAVLDVAVGIPVVNRVHMFLALYPWVFDAMDFAEAATALANGMGHKRRLNPKSVGQGKGPKGPQAMEIDSPRLT